MFLHRALQGMTASSVIVGLDLRTMSWLTAGAAPHPNGCELLPPLDGALFVDDAHRDAAQDDFGHIVQRRPVAVLLPGSVNDIIAIIRYARCHGLRVAMRGNGHSPFGQAQVEAGILIDSNSLATAPEIGSSPECNAWVDVGPGTLWRSVIQEAFDHGLTPPVLTDFQGLSVGGTLSVGGIGGTTQTFGVQADNVLELEVVTGTGEHVVCSDAQRPRLFNAVLAGLGQSALIVRARLPLIPAPTQVMTFNLFYNDIEDYVSDQLRMLSLRRFDHLQGQVVAGPSGWRFMIEAATFFTPPDQPNPASLLAGLRDVRADTQTITQSYLEYAFRLDPLIEFLISIGVWDFPHPWMDLFVPASQASNFVGDVLSSLTSADTGGGPILFYPVDRRRIRRPFFRLPHERRSFLFSLLRTADPSSPDSVPNMLSANRDIYERLVEVGGTRYANGAIPFNPDDWRRHFGSSWRALQAAKRRYDPDRLLTPGQGIFPPEE
jgi:cytokinin dehydrogenase